MAARFPLGRQSSLAPERDKGSEEAGEVEDVVGEAINPKVKLMYLANEGDLKGIEELLDDGTDVNFSDIDGRTALHVAACQGRADVVQLLLRRGAEVDLKDRWGSTVILHYPICLNFLLFSFWSSFSNLQLNFHLSYWRSREGD